MRGFVLVFSRVHFSSPLLATLPNAAGALRVAPPPSPYGEWLCCDVYRMTACFCVRTCRRLEGQLPEGAFVQRRKLICFQMFLSTCKLFFPRAIFSFRVQVARLPCPLCRRPRVRSTCSFHLCGPVDQSNHCKR